MGAHNADMRAVPAQAFADPTLVIVDSLSAAQTEAGDLIEAVRVGALPWSAVRELGETLAGTPLDPRGRTVFKSVGIASQDLAIATVLRHEMATGSA